MARAVYSSKLGVLSSNGAAGLQTVFVAQPGFTTVLRDVQATVLNPQNGLGGLYFAVVDSVTGTRVELVSLSSTGLYLGGPGRWEGRLVMQPEDFMVAFCNMGAATEYQVWASGYQLTLP